MFWARDIRLDIRPDVYRIELSFSAPHFWGWTKGYFWRCHPCDCCGEQKNRGEKQFCKVWAVKQVPVSYLQATRQGLNMFQRRFGPFFGSLFAFLCNSGNSGYDFPYQTKKFVGNFVLQTSYPIVLQTSYPKVFLGRPLKSTWIIGVPKSEFFEYALAPLSSNLFPHFSPLFPLQALSPLLPLSLVISPFFDSWKTLI